MSDELHVGAIEKAIIATNNLGYPMTIGQRRDFIATAIRTYNEHVDQAIHDPMLCEHAQCGHAHEQGYISGRRASVEAVRRIADQMEAYDAR